MTAPSSAAWGHLLRDIHDQRTLYPDDAPLAKWADAVHGIYDRAKACTHPQAKRRRTAQLALERQLLALGQPFRHDPSATQAKLCRRIERHIKELFVFVAEPAVPSDNNAAEPQPAPSGHQPQGQRRHPVGAGHRAQDDAGIHLRHLARPRSKSSRRLPSVARFPSTLNCYGCATDAPVSSATAMAHSATCELNARSSQPWSLPFPVSCLPYVSASIAWFVGL